MTNKEYKVALLKELGAYCFCRHCLHGWATDRSWKRYRRTQYVQK